MWKIQLKETAGMDSAMKELQYEYILYEGIAHPERALSPMFSDKPPVLGEKVGNLNWERRVLHFWRTDTVDTAPIRYTVVVTEDKN